MQKEEIIRKTADYVKSILADENSGHDWWHISRVWNNAINIGNNEGVDMYVVELAALLHDIADWKFNEGDINKGVKVSKEWLESLYVEENVIQYVCDIVKNISFKGAEVKNLINTKEGMVVQDADRLDAIGAIGIARTFAYGGHAGRVMYNPNIKPQLHDTFEKYKANNSPTINHFYEKLLLLKDMLNTESAKKIAENRHKYMEGFLDEFYAECNGKA